MLQQIEKNMKCEICAAAAVQPKLFITAKRAYTMSLVITSTKKNAGKTMVGLGIGLNCPGKVGFFKPLGTNLVQGADEDVLLFKEVFQLKEDSHLFNISRDYHRILHDLKEGEDFTDILRKRYAQLAQGKDFMLIETAHTMSYGSYTGLSAPQVAAVLDCPGLLIAEGEPDTIIDKSIIANHCFNVKDATLLGVVINKSTFRKEARAQLEEKGINILGVIPENEELKTPTCEDVIDILDGELIAGEEGLCKKVKTIVVGAMTYDTAERTLQQMEFPENTVMVTGGDRADMQLLAFEIKSSLLVLAGNTYPSMTILAKADELGIPVIMVPYDTMTAASRCEQATAKLNSSHAPLIKELVKKYVDLDQIFEASL